MADGNAKPVLTYSLKYPISDHEGGTINEINIMRRPTGGDMVGIPLQAMEIPHFLRLGAKLARIPYPIISKMDAADAVAFANELSDFFVKE